MLVKTLGNLQTSSSSFISFAADAALMQNRIRGFSVELFDILRLRFF